MRGHDDAKADKKLFSSMLKKSMPAKKVTTHLKKDMSESKKSIKDDKKLMKTVKKGKS
jgi:hypothetical protein